MNLNGQLYQYLWREKGGGEGEGVVEKSVLLINMCAVFVTFFFFYCCRCLPFLLEHCKEKCKVSGAYWKDRAGGLVDQRLNEELDGLRVLRDCR